MKAKITGIAVLFGLFIFVSSVFSADKIRIVKLPAPGTVGGRPLMQVLKERKSSREFSPKELSLQVLSDLLWAGFGVNRPQAEQRTAPSARNMQEISIFVAKADGLYLYQAQDNCLELVLAEDIRAATGKQDFVKNAPVNLIYVADFSKMTNAGEQKDLYAAMDTGFIAENVYLFCASEGLATVVRGLFDQDKLRTVMKLRADQKITLTQSVGYPAKK